MPQSELIIRLRKYNALRAKGMLAPFAWRHAFILMKVR